MNVTRLDGVIISFDLAGGPVRVSLPSQTPVGDPIVFVLSQDHRGTQAEVEGWSNLSPPRLAIRECGDTNTKRVDADHGMYELLPLVKEA